MKLTILLTAASILLMLPIIIFAADGTITGSVTDYESGDPLWDVLINVPTAHFTTNSDFQGNYQFTLPEGKHVIKFSVMGYSTLVKHVTITADTTLTLNAPLSVSELATGLIVRSTTTAREVTVSQTTIEKSRIDNTSRAGFTSDITTTLKKLPGVASDGTFSGALYIRGGSPWENLFILDRVILTFPYKWGGLITMINPDIVKKVNFYTGGFPAEYGQAMSGLIHCETLDPPKDRKTHGRLKMDPANFNYYQYGPLTGIGNNSGYVISSRATYYDLIAPIFIKMSGDGDMNTEGIRFPWFYDAFGKVFLDIHRKHKLIFSSLCFNDGMKMTFDSTPPGQNDDTYGNDAYKSIDVSGSFRYSDTTMYMSGTWKYIPGDKLTLYTTSSWIRQWGHYKYKQGVYFYELDNFTENGTNYGPHYSFKGDYDYWIAHFQRDEYQIYANAHYSPAEYYTINIGTTIIPYQITYCDKEGFLLDDYEIHGNGTNSYLIRTQKIEHFGSTNNNKSLYGAVFLENEISIIPQRWILHVGIREHIFQQTGQSITEPRLMTKITLFDGWDFKLSGGRFSQFPFIEANSDTQGNTKLHAEESYHYIGGIEKIIPFIDLKIRSEVFYKTYNNIIVAVEQKEGNYQNWAIGEAKGYELFLEKALSKRIEGWFAYTYTEAWRKVTSKANNSSLANIAFYQDAPRINVKYAPDNHQKHIININIDYHITKWLMVNADFRYHTGAPYTKIDSVYADYSSVTNFYVSNATLLSTNVITETNYIPTYSDTYHGERLNDYYCLNLGVNFNQTLFEERQYKRYTNTLGPKKLMEYNDKIDIYLKQLSETTNKRKQHKINTELSRAITCYDKIQNKLWKFSENPQLHNRLLMRAQYEENKHKAARLVKRYDRKIQPKAHRQQWTIYLNAINALNSKNVELGKWFDSSSGENKSEKDLPLIILSGFMLKY